MLTIAAFGIEQRHLWTFGHTFLEAGVKFPTKSDYPTHNNFHTAYFYLKALWREAAGSFPCCFARVRAVMLVIPH